jgi:hypothetical protein
MNIKQKHKTASRFRIAGGIKLLALWAIYSVTVWAQQPVRPEPPLANYSGLWLEIRPVSGPPMNLKLTQNGSQVTVQLSYNGTFGDDVFGIATINNDRATWTVPQPCAPQFRTAGYNYDNPGINLCSIALRQGFKDGQPARMLVYEQDVRWNVPCGGNPIGTQRIRKTLSQVGFFKLHKRQP